MFNGFLSVDKPALITAHDCVSKLRKLPKQKKIGHGGTLDPMATGVLPIAVGNATRLLRFLPEGKAYIAKIRFGLVTDTDDITGVVLSDRPSPDLRLEEVTKHFPQFIGNITQRPPAFSAIQVNGQRLYDLARRGEMSGVEIPMRSVEIKEIQDLAWTNGDYPELDVAIACGSGTYIRAIARDLGEIIGCGATLSGLRRTYSNGFGLDASLTFEQIADLLHSNRLEVLATDHGLHFLPILSLDEDTTKRWCMGQSIAKQVLGEICDASQLISTAQHDIKFTRTKFARTYSSEQQFLGVSEICETGIQPIVVLHPIN